MKTKFNNISKSVKMLIMVPMTLIKFLKQEKTYQIKKELDMIVKIKRASRIIWLCLFQPRTRKKKKKCQERLLLQKEIKPKVNLFTRSQKSGFVTIVVNIRTSNHYVINYKRIYIPLSKGRFQENINLLSS